MSLDPTPPDPSVWDPAAPLEGAGRSADMDARQWALIRYVGQPMGQCIPLPAEGLTVGRSPENALCLPEPEVSRRHARLEIPAAPDYVELRDLHSTNGLFVNGRRVCADPGPIWLRAEDVLRIAGNVFKLKRMDALERLYHQDLGAPAATDPLTGVGARATVLEQLESHVGLACRHQRPLSVILADLDRFKSFNDVHGHQAGDQALAAFGALLRQRLRGSDLVGRVGGDEFLILLPEASASAALIAAEGLRRALADHPLGLEATPSLSCSLGVAALKPGDRDGGALLARADAALYRAKAGGRDRAHGAP